MEYQGDNVAPQDSAAAASEQSAWVQQQQQEYDYSGAYADGDVGAYNYDESCDDYSAAEEQQQVYGTAPGSEEGAYYDPATGAFYSDDTAYGNPLTELAIGTEGGYSYDGNNSGSDYNYDGYEWDEAAGQYRPSPPAFGYNEDEENGEGAEDTPPSPFKDEAYWEQELYNQPASPEEETEEQSAGNALPVDGVAAADGESAPSTPADASTESAETPGSEMPSSKSSSARSKASTPSWSKKKKPKSKKERTQMRQELLEKEEEKKLQKQNGGSPDARESSDPTAATKTAKPNADSAAAAPLQKKLTFIEREKAKIHLQIRKARAIARKRIPLQVRILTQTRRHLSPLEKYFESRSVEATLSDIFWAALKGDIRRVRHLVEVESMQQSPLHWAAKGGSREVIEYLLTAGANARCLDENGSLPLHIACWAGHIDATLSLLKAGDARDLYIQDFDAALAPLDWATIRGHAPLLKAIAKFEDSLWLPKFIDDLIRGIVRYKIKVFKPPPKPAKLALVKEPEAGAVASATATASDQAAGTGASGATTTTTVSGVSDSTPSNALTTAPGQPLDISKTNTGTLASLK